MDILVRLAVMYAILIVVVVAVLALGYVWVCRRERRYAVRHDA